MRLGGAGSGRAGRGGAQEEPREAGIEEDGRGSVASLPLVGAQRAGFSSNDFRRWSDHRKTVVIVSSTHPQGSWARAGRFPLCAETVAVRAPRRCQTAEPRRWGRCHRQ